MTKIIFNGQEYLFEMDLSKIMLSDIVRICMSLPYVKGYINEIIIDKN